MVIDIKMCRFDNVPWGFRLVGGADFEIPLTIVKVTEGSIAEEAGLRAGDIIVRINDTPTSPLTHDETNKTIKNCGNVFYFGIQRECEEVEVAPKQFPILGLERPTTPQGFLDANSTVAKNADEDLGETEYLPDLADRPSSVLSENTEIKLEEKEIAAVLSGESEVLKDHQVMGIFPKPGVCMSSDVLRTLNEEAVKTKAEKDKENKKWTTFLQKPNRPIPKSKEQLEAERRAANAYKVKIVKSAPRTPERSVSPAPVPRVEPAKPQEEPQKPEKQPTPPEEPEPEEPPPADSEVPNLEQIKIVIETVPDENNNEEEKSDASKEIQELAEAEAANDAKVAEEGAEGDHETASVDEAETAVEVAAPVSEPPVEKTEEELALERQLADVQQQLAALSSLPSTIQATLDAVTKQLATLLPTFKLQQAQTVKAEAEAAAAAAAEVRSISLEKIDEAAEVPNKAAEEDAENNNTEVTLEQQESVEEIDEERDGIDENVEPLSPVKQFEAQQRKEETRQMEEEQTLKKQKKHDVIEELAEQLERNKTNAKRSKRAFGPLTPSSERPLVLPGGRRWYRPKDAYNDEFIAETLSAQAELITGTTLGCTFESPLLPYDASALHAASVARQLDRQSRVNFMKYQKPERKIDLNRSEVYKVIHHLDRQPVRGIEVRPPVVPAEVDIRKALHS